MSPDEFWLLGTIRGHHDPEIAQLYIDSLKVFIKPAGGMFDIIPELVVYDLPLASGGGVYYNLNFLPTELETFNGKMRVLQLEMELSADSYEYGWKERKVDNGMRFTRELTDGLKIAITIYDRWSIALIDKLVIQNPTSTHLSLPLHSPIFISDRGDISAWWMNPRVMFVITDDARWEFEKYMKGDQ